MSELIGKCHCNKNTFKISGEAAFQFKCYCKTCGELNSSGYLCGMVFDEANLTPATQTQIYSYNGGSGNPINMHFCPVCATTLYALPTEMPGKVVIRPNVLPAVNFKPQQSIFTEEALSWAKPDSQG